MSAECEHSFERVELHRFDDEKMCQMCGGVAELYIGFQNRIGHLILCADCLTVVESVAQDGVELTEGGGDE